MHLAPLAEGCSHNRASSRLPTGKTGIISFRSHCPFPHAAKLASMKRNFARLSARVTPPAPAVSLVFRGSVSATAPRSDAATPGRIDSDSLRGENQTGSNPIKVNPSRSNRFKPQKIKNPRTLCFHFSAKVGVASPWGGFPWAYLSVGGGCGQRSAGLRPALRSCPG